MILFRFKFFQANFGTALYGRPRMAQRCYATV